MHEMLEHAHKCCAFARLKRIENEALRALDRRGDVFQQPDAGGRDVQRFGAAVGSTGGAPDQPLFLKAADHVADGRAVERDGIAQSRLVEARLIADRGERCILHRREIKRLRLVQEQRQRDLLQPPDEMAGHAEKATVILCHRLSLVDGRCKLSVH